METSLDRAAEWIATSRKTIALTGAGVSTESGIPDFRSPTGLWARYNPLEYATLSAFRRNPKKVWKLFAEITSLLEVKPNPGHLALAELELSGGLKGIITQNIDGLHQAAGSRKVVEFHGSPRTLSCLACGARYTFQEIAGLGMPPCCSRETAGKRCSEILKPDVVLYDEMIPPTALRDSSELVQGAELVLVIGTSCETYPAGAIPQQVRSNGGRIIEINLEPARSLTADIQLIGKFSGLTPDLVSRWKKKLGR